MLGRQRIEAIAQTRWVERWIARDEMLHVPINAKESDARGRGDPFAALGWAKRLRDYFDAVIQKHYAGAAYIWWIKVAGGAGDVQRLSSTAIPSAKAQPGSYMMTNDAVEVQSMGSQVRASVSGEGTAYDALLNHIAPAFGLNKARKRLLGASFCIKRTGRRRVTSVSERRVVAT